MQPFVLFGSFRKFGIAPFEKLSMVINYSKSASFGGTVLNKVGPAITACFGVLGYILYVGSLWYFDQVGKQVFPIFAGVCIGVSKCSRVYQVRG
jgi:hypothetical protein